MKRIKKDLFKQVNLDNDASEVDILGHVGTFWDNSENFMMWLKHLNSFPSHFGLFSPIFGSLDNKKHVPDGPMDQRTDGRTDNPSYRDAWTNLKNFEWF